MEDRDFSQVHEPAWKIPIKMLEYEDRIAALEAENAALREMLPDAETRAAIVDAIEGAPPDVFEPVTTWLDKLEVDEAPSEP